jgi:hypothetical protein
MAAARVGSVDAVTTLIDRGAPSMRPMPRSSRPR